MFLTSVKYKLKMKLKHLLVTILAFLVAASAFAQSYSVKLRLIEEKTSEPVQFATVSITKVGSTKAYKYALTVIRVQLRLQRSLRAHI